MAKKKMLITIAIAFVVIITCIYVLGYWNDWGDGTFRVKSSQVNNINNDLYTVKSRKVCTFLGNRHSGSSCCKIKEYGVIRNA